MPSSNPRYRKPALRNALRRKFIRRGDACAICGRPIDYTLRPGDPSKMWFELDEIVPISRGGSPYDEDNLQATHMICNRKKGDRMPDERKPANLSLTTSREW